MKPVKFFAKLILAIAFLASGLLFFQNCTQTSFDASKPAAQTESLSAGGGHGGGYDGKLYVELVNCGTNKTSYNSQIRYDEVAKRAQMERENCTDLNPAQELDFEVITIANDQRTLEYRGRKFVDLVAVSEPGKIFYSTAGTHTFIVPAWVSKVRVTVVGGGASAGAHGNYTTSVGSTLYSWGSGAGGGGGGGYAQGLATVTPEASIDVQVGAGGDAPAYCSGCWANYGQNTNGSNGGGSSAVDISAAGGGAGSGGRSEYPSPQSNQAGGVGGAGGAGTGGAVLRSGADGIAGAASGTVSGDQGSSSGEGGTGGRGFMLNGVSCGDGGAGPGSKSFGAISTEQAGRAGCVLLEWGPGI